MVTVIDVCSGIGSFSLAAHRAGLKTIAQIEVDSYRRDILARHFPDVLRLEDLYDVTANDIPNGRCDILAGGTPCQDLSIAGRGAGLAGKKSSLWYEYLRLAQELKPTWLVWENVPGALSSNGGRDFLTILRGLDELGYHVAWRVLDAQYFGVPQRRRRIFLVGHLRNGNAAQVLFEQNSVQGNSNSRPTAWKTTPKVAGTLSKSASGTSRTGNGNETDFLITQPHRATAAQTVYRQQRSDKYTPSTVASTLAKRDYKDATDLVVKIDNTSSNGWGVLEDGTTHSLGGSTDAVLSVDLQQITSPTNRSRARNISPSLTKSSDVIAFNGQAGSAESLTPSTQAPSLRKNTVIDVMSNHIVRRLTPMECERLQGFPDSWTSGQSDTKRYEQLGDSIAVPCSEWIMSRIARIEGVKVDANHLVFAA